MHTASRRRSGSLRNLLVTGLALLSSGLGHARILDDFNDNSKTGWQDFSFVAGAFLPVEQNQQFSFDLTGVPQTMFSASWKNSETIELKEGRTVELRVDLVNSSGQDCFAVLGFIPNTGGNTPLSLAGYALAKDPDDVLMTKGISKYFVADDGVTAELKNENVTLSLSLTAKGGSVTVTGRILDKDNNDAVLWERTVVDTPAADVLQDGTDDPPAPYITTGHFSLYCYAENGNPSTPYTVTLDNADVYIMDEVVVDDFNDNTKTGWDDFSFVAGAFLATEQNQQFTFDLSGAPQTLFSAGWKSSRLLELKEGEQLELRVDALQSSGENSFYVMGFIPNTGGNNPLTLAGYGLAKDPTDVLITKGIQKYFVADDSATAEIKNDRVRLVLRLLVKGGKVWITGRILDLDDNNAVLWERTMVDTAAADVLADGTDDPAAPFITTGHFTLYCYAQDPVAGTPYTVNYDDAVILAAPAPANLPPSILDIQPAAYANFQTAATTQVRFTASDDAALSADKLAITLAGTRYTTANGLTVTGTGTSLTASLGGLQPDQNYTATVEAEDAEGLLTSRLLYFDTFLPTHRVIEAEDYNYGAGTWIENPVPTMEGGFDQNSYSLLAGIEATDFHDTRTSPSFADTPYRPDDPVRMQRSLDLARKKYTDAGGSAAFVYDYDVGDIATGEWLQFTRTFAPGSYEVYLREALANMPGGGESVLELVTGDRTQPDAASTPLGSFLGALTGFQYRNFPLTDGSGVNKVVLTLNGVTTLRLRQVTADPGDGSRFLNYLVFIPVADPGTQRARVSAVSPANGSTANTVAPVIQVHIQNQDTSVQVGTIQLRLNDQLVAATVTATADGADVTFPIAPLPASGSTNTAIVAYKDSENTDLSTTWSFIVRYTTLDPAFRIVGSGKDRGFNVRVVQAPAGSALENSLQRAESQLAAGSTIPKQYETNVVAPVINFGQDGPDLPAGTFPNDAFIPGLDTLGDGTDDIAMAVTVYLDLAAGTYRFGVQCDDGYMVQSVSAFPAVDATPIGFHNGGPADETFDLVVTQAGLYPLRLVWYERGGGAHVEWFTADFTTGTRTLLNDTASTVRAFATVEAAVQAQFNAPTVSGGNLNLSWTGPGELQEATAITGPWSRSASQTSPQSVPAGAGNKFFRIVAP